MNIILKFFLLIAISVSANYGQEITLTTSTANVIASRATIDLPALFNNPDAIIVATPLGGLNKSNSHPIGAWYYNGKWSIFNTDHANIPIGLKFKVEVFLRPDANHFLHVITEENLSGEGSYIDHQALNNNPNAQFKILQNHAPENRSNYLNKFEAKAEYNAAAGKWAIKNVNGERLYPNTAYNVVISPMGTSAQKAVAITELTITPQQKSGINSVCNCPIPTSLPPDGNAGGDLSGTYPNPTVQRLAGRHVANVAPNVGDILRWNGNAWEPAPVNNNNTTVAGDLSGTYPNPTVQKLNGKPLSSNAPAVGQVLKWNGTAWQPADDNVAPATATSPATVSKPTFLYYEQSTSGNAPEVGLINTTAIIPGLDNKFFTLTQSSRVVFHTNVSLLNTNTTPFGSGGVGKVVVQIFTNTSNAVVATDQSFTAIFPNTTVSSNSTGYVILPLGTYYTKVSITKYVDTPFKAIAGRLIIEIFPN